jgi:hypothetical protein
MPQTAGLPRARRPAGVECGLIGQTRVRAFAADLAATSARLCGVFTRAHVCLSVCLCVCACLFINLIITIITLKLAEAKREASPVQSAVGEKLPGFILMTRINAINAITRIRCCKTKRGGRRCWARSSWRLHTCIK